jgi:hypothetical protein
MADEGALLCANSLCVKVLMADPEQEPTTATTTEARAASTPHMTRYVLSIGLILVIVLFGIIVLVGRS